MSHIDEATLNRLVDGELDEPEYRRTLLRLDVEPDGWKRCALAFLEHQALQRELGDCLADLSEEKGRARGIPARRKPAPHRRRGWEIVLAAAAGLVLAVWGGFEYQRGRTPQQASARTDSSVARSSTDHVVGRERREPADSAQGESFDPVGNVLLVMDPTTGGQSQRVHLPVYPPEAWESLLRNRSAFPDHVERALNRLGSDVRRDVFLTPVQLEDGRQLLIPLEQVEINPAGLVPTAY